MFSIVVAYDQDRGIAKHGKIPWPRSAVDMQHFVAITSKPGSAVVMGRKTWDTLKQPLKNRANIVLSKQDIIVDGGHVFDSFDFAMRTVAEVFDRVFVIGGQEIYELAMRDEKCHEIYVTEFPGSYGADRFFPPIPDCFTVTSQHIVEGLTFKHYEKLNTL